MRYFFYFFVLLASLFPNCVFLLLSLLFSAFVLFIHLFIHLFVNFYLILLILLIEFSLLFEIQIFILPQFIGIFFEKLIDVCNLYLRYTLFVFGGKNNIFFYFSIILISKIVYLLNKLINKL